MAAEKIGSGHGVAAGGLEAVDPEDPLPCLDEEALSGVGQEDGAGRNKSTGYT